MQQAIGGDLDAVEREIDSLRRVEPELLGLVRHLDIGAVDEEGGDAARALAARIGAREGEDRAAEAAVRDPLLRAGDPPAVAGRLGAGAKRARVGAGARLGEREGADRLATRERRDEATLLLGRAEGEDRQRAGTRVHRDGDAHAGICARKLFEHEDVRDEVGTAASVLLRDAHAEQADVAELAEKPAREAAVSVPSGGMRLDLVAGEVACERLDLPLFRRQGEIHTLSLTLVTSVQLPACSRRRNVSE